MYLRAKFKRILKKIASGLLYDTLQFYYWKLNIKSGKLSEKEIYALPMIIKPKDYAIDIGAHYGRFTYPLSQIVGQDGHVFSVEPVYHCFSMLNRIVDALKLTNVSIYNIALSNQNGEIEMVIPTDQSGLHVYSCSHIVNEYSADNEALISTQKIQCQTLDQFVTSNEISKIDLIKCDVEGAELLILQGSENVIKKYHPVLILEIESRHTQQYNYEPEDLLTLLCQYGYKAHIFIGAEIIPTQSIIPDQNNYIFF